MCLNGIRKMITGGLNYLLGKVESLASSSFQRRKQESPFPISLQGIKLKTIGIF
jgi:hypothetical protein